MIPLRAENSWIEKPIAGSIAQIDLPQKAWHRAIMSLAAGDLEEWLTQFFRAGFDVSPENISHLAASAVHACRGRHWRSAPL
jgi:hypothetical protein